MKNVPIFTLNFANGESYDVLKNTALVFIDETGNEQLSDPNYPIFGMGGCVIFADNYIDHIHNPWEKMKDTHFNQSMYPLHASDNNFNSDQISALNDFFLQNKFGRFASLASLNTTVDTILQIEQIVYFSAINRIIDISKYSTFNKIVIIYEHSDRLMPKLEYYNKDISFTDESGVAIPIEFCCANKSLCIPGIEIADFIVHSAGTSLRDKISNKITNLSERKDFSNIFVNVDENYPSFLYLNNVSYNEAPN